MEVKEPVIFREKDEMRKWSRSMRSQGKTIGLVPTMGYLHQGHLSLVEETHKHAEVVVVSIYVNPGQFSPSEDLSTYPSDFHSDILKLKGVATSVTKLFNIVELDVAVFGKKDYQQWRIIQRMVRGLDFGIEIVGSDIVRDSDGLALSLRVVHLSPEEREKALSMSRSLLKAKSDAKIGLLGDELIMLRLWSGRVRLIDNI
ncbi:hypothetical protein SLA2020_373290 [Shorea laevis]